MQRLARFAVRRRWVVVLAWIAFIVGAQALASAAGGADFKSEFRLPGTETQAVFTLLQNAGLSGATGQTGTMVLHAHSAPNGSGSLDPSAPPAALPAALQAQCTKTDHHIVSLVSPWTANACVAGGRTPQANPELLSSDRTTALVVITWAPNQNSMEVFNKAYDDLVALKSGSLDVYFTGDGFGQVAQSKVHPEAIGFLAALIILAFVFRAFLPTILPLVSAGAALGAGFGLIALLSRVMNVASFAQQLALLMVLGVGVDYALFIVTRHRRNLLAGMAMEESLVLAVNTSGRAVFFAGCTVCIAILGLWSLGVSFFYGVSVAVAIGVALTMVASLTLMPALLSFIGLRVLPRRVRSAVANGTYVASTKPTRWARWSNFVASHKLVTSLGAGAFMVVLAIPFFALRLGHADQGNDPAGATTRQGYDLITAKFGEGYNSTLELVVSGPRSADPAFLDSVESTLKTTPNVDAASLRATPTGRGITLISFKTTTSPQDERTTSLVGHLRNDVLPPLYRGSSDHVYVFGGTATFIDFAAVIADKMPLFLAAVVGLSFLLLLIAFRSLLVPLTGALMNLLATAASFGVVVAIFQWGWGAELLGIGSGGPIEAFAPVMFFAILFGLSMDYQVFLVSRMHEEWLHTRDNAEAITVGQSETGGIITAAALIMVTVFGGFVLGDQRVIKLFGIGLAGAIALDAFVLRTVLVPALMHVFGKANWYFPKWLERVTPRVSVEAPDDATAPLVHAGAAS